VPLRKSMRAVKAGWQVMLPTWKFPAAIASRFATDARRGVRRFTPSDGEGAQGAVKKKAAIQSGSRAV